MTFKKLNKCSVVVLMKQNKLPKIENLAAMVTVAKVAKSKVITGSTAWLR